MIGPTGTTPRHDFLSITNTAAMAASASSKRARRHDVKAMVAELQKPSKEKLQKQIEANFEFATEKLMSIANAKLDLSKIKASDEIRAIEVRAKLHGWNAPEKNKLGGEDKIERIELVIVEPKKRDGGSVPPASGVGDQE
jgi:hypothetical protein